MTDFKLVTSGKFQKIRFSNTLPKFKKQHVRCVNIMEDVVVDDLICDAANKPSAEQPCRIACPGDCVISSWSSWSPCQHVQVFCVDHDRHHDDNHHFLYSVVEKEEEKGPSSGIQFSTELVRHYKNWNLVPVRLVADVFHTIGKSLNGVRVSHWADPIVEKVSGLESPLVYETIITSSIPS